MQVYVTNDYQYFNYCNDSVCICIADEREDVQKKTFAKWINSQLLKVRTTTVWLNIICQTYVE